MKHIESMKQALQKALEMLNDNREYIEANERPVYLETYDKAIADAEKALKEQAGHGQAAAWLRTDGMKAISALEKQSWIDAGRPDMVADYTVACVLAEQAGPKNVGLTIYTRDETEHGKNYYLADDVDAMLGRLEQQAGPVPEGWKLAIERFAAKERGIPQAHIAAELLAELDAMLAAAPAPQAEQPKDFAAYAFRWSGRHTPCELRDTYEQVSREWSEVLDHGQIVGLIAVPVDGPAPQAEQPAPQEQPIGIMSRAMIVLSAGAGYKQVGLRFTELCDAEQVRLWALSCGAKVAPAEAYPQQPSPVQNEEIDPDSRTISVYPDQQQVPAQQETALEQPRARMSKDYKRLFDIICSGEIAIGLVNYHHTPDGTSPMPQMRDVCKIKRRADYDISFSARGISYGDIYPSNAHKGEELQLFLNMCKFHDLEFVDFDPPQRHPLGVVETIMPHIRSIGVKHIEGASYPDIGDLVYTTPPQRQPLTDEMEVRRLISEEYDAWIRAHAGGMGYDEFLKQRLASRNITGGKP